MPFEEELAKVDHFLDEFAAGRIPDTRPLLKQWLRFLDALLEESSGVDEEQHAYLSVSFQRIRQKVVRSLASVMERAKLNSDQLHKMAENPNNYKKEMWNDLQALQGQINKKLELVIPILARFQKKGKEGAPASPKKATEPKAVASERRRKRRDRWISG